jgi:Protein of unknown function (DUF3592)
MMAPMTKQFIYRLLRRLALLLFVFYCFRAVRLEFGAKEKYREISRWPVAHAVVQSASVSLTSFSWSPRKIRYCPDMEYSYSVAGRTYTNRNQIFDFSCKPDADGFVAKYGPGTSVLIAYDPTNPNTTVIPSSIVDAWDVWVDLIGGIFFSVVLLADLSATRSESPA